MGIFYDFLNCKVLSTWAKRVTQWVNFQPGDDSELFFVARCQSCWFSSRCRSRMWKPLTFGWQCAFSLSSLLCWSMRPSTSLHANTRSCCASIGGEGILRWVLRSKHTSSISPDPLWWIFTVLGIQTFNVLMVAFIVTEYSKYLIRASKSIVWWKTAWCHIQGFQTLAFNSALLQMKIKITIWIY